MSKACLPCIAIVLATICLHVNAESFLQTYQIEHNSEMIPNDAGFVFEEIDCISKVESIGICMVTSGCQGINHFEDLGRCQFVTNILDSALYEAATSVTFIYPFLGFSAQPSVSRYAIDSSILIWDSITDNIGGHFDGTHFSCPLSMRYEVKVMFFTEQATSMYFHVYKTNVVTNEVTNMQYHSGENGELVSWSGVLECTSDEQIYKSSSGTGYHARDFLTGSRFSIYTHA